VVCTTAVGSELGSAKICIFSADLFYIKMYIIPHHFFLYYSLYIFLAQKNLFPINPPTKAPAWDIGSKQC
jgi:hypothetical protein